MHFHGSFFFIGILPVAFCLIIRYFNSEIERVASEKEFACEAAGTIKYIAPNRTVSLADKGISHTKAVSAGIGIGGQD